MIKEIELKQFPFKPVPQAMFGAVRPGVFRREHTGGYGIRIEKSYHRGPTTISMAWDYFELDSTGLITKSPHGMAKRFNKKVRITDIDKHVDKIDWNR